MTLKISDEIRQNILYSAEKRGMTQEDASVELDALLGGNRTTYTARIRSIITSLLGG